MNPALDNSVVELVVKQNSQTRLTITNTRITLKMGVNVEPIDYEKYINMSLHVANYMRPVRVTFRGQFTGPDYVLMQSDSRKLHVSFKLEGDELHVRPTKGNISDMRLISPDGTS